MNVHPRVFVVNVPLRRDPVTKAWMHVIDVAPAAEYGTLVELLPPGRPEDYEAALTTLRIKLHGFRPTDYLLPVGDTVMIAWAAALAAQASGGYLNVLAWDNRTKEYRPAGSQVFETELEPIDA